MMQLNEGVARKVLGLVDRGLVQGLGEQVPGEMCVEAAVCFALGLPHGDEPPCVGSAVRAYKIRLNDSIWSSEQARAKGMRRVAIAQLGSNLINQRAFADYVIVQGVRRILPIALRAAAERASDAHKGELLAAISECEAAADIPSARLAADHSKKAARAYAYAYAAAAYAADAAAYAAYADADAARDRTLSLAAEIAVEALQAQNCEGCQWLDLCDEPVTV